VLGSEEAISPFYRRSETGKKYRTAGFLQHISTYSSFRRKLKPLQDLSWLMHVGCGTSRR